MSGGAQRASSKHPCALTPLARDEGFPPEMAGETLPCEQLGELRCRGAAALALLRCHHGHTDPSVRDSIREQLFQPHRGRSTRKRLRVGLHTLEHLRGNAPQNAPLGRPFQTPPPHVSGHIPEP
jgi:hypothetical protein